MARGYIPRSDAEFNDWFTNLVSYVVSKTSGPNPAWDHIPQRHVQELSAVIP